MQKIRKGDQVVVTTGKEKGKTRHRAARASKPARSSIEGVNRVKKHQRPNPVKGQTGGIIDKEMPLAISNVMLREPGHRQGRPRRIQVPGSAGGQRAAQGALLQVQRRSRGRLRVEHMAKEDKTTRTRRASSEGREAARASRARGQDAEARAKASARQPKQPQGRRSRSQKEAAPDPAARACKVHYQRARSCRR